MLFTIRQARVHAGLTQEEVAKALNIDRTTYRKIEKDPDRATLNQIREIAAVTGIPAEKIFLAENSTKVE